LDHGSPRRIKKTASILSSLREWVLADYGDFLVHVFSPKSRAYFDLERLYRHAKIVPIPEE
jgi:ribosomal silencing factor RsfS